MRYDVTFKFKRGSSEEWAEKNTILKDGEPGVDDTTGNFKIGDGSTHWNDLEYFLPVNEADPGDISGVVAALNAHIASQTPHTVYDDGPSLALLYENVKAG